MTAGDKLRAARGVQSHCQEKLPTPPTTPPGPWGMLPWGTCLLHADVTRGRIESSRGEERPNVWFSTSLTQTPAVRGTFMDRFPCVGIHSSFSFFSHVERPTFLSSAFKRRVFVSPNVNPQIPTVCLKSLPSRRGCCSADRSAECPRTALGAGSTSEGRSMSTSIRYDRFLKGSNVCKTRHKKLCLESVGSPNRALLKGIAMHGILNDLKLNLD